MVVFLARTDAYMLPTRLFIGESFVEASEDSAHEYIEKRVEVGGPHAMEQLIAAVDDLVGACRKRTMSSRSCRRRSPSSRLGRR